MEAAVVVTTDTEAPDFSEQLSAIVNRLAGLAAEQVRRKSVIETRWLDDLRAFHGRYDSTVEQQLTAAKKSRAFVKITRKKTNAWQARLQELLFPTDDRNWGIQPTPVPRLTKDAQAAVEQAKALLEKANATVPPDGAENDPAAQAQAAEAAQMAQQAEALHKSASDMQVSIAEAKKRSDAMQEVMDDQLKECHYHAEGRELIQDACRIGTGILKGPLAGGRRNGSWKESEGKYDYVREDDPAPVYVRIDPWSYFPDMSASRPEDAEFEFQRHLWSKKDLRRLVRDNGFDPAATRRLIEGDRSQVVTSDVSLNYLADLRSITGEGEGITGRYVGWEYHGPLEPNEIAILMRAAASALPADDGGIDEATGNEILSSYHSSMAEADAYEAAADPLEERRVIVYFCDGEVLKVVPEYVLDSGESLFSVFTFEPGEWSIFGYGVPSIMSDSQRAINGAWRMAMDNAGLSVGPQIVIDTESIDPVDGTWEITPRKVWRRKRSQGVTIDEAFKVYNIPSSINEIITIVREAHAHADDETALPTISEGEAPEGQGNQTAAEVHTRSAGSNVTFRRVVKSYDDGITTPSMRRLYDWNMQFNPRDDIKGDMSIDARGTSVLLVREVQGQMMMAIAVNWTTHPVLGMMVNAYGTARKTLQSMMIPPDDVLKTEDEFKALVKAQAEQPPEPAPQVIAAQAAVERAKIDAESAEKVAKIHHETEMIKLAEQKNMTIEQLKANLAGKQLDNEHKERLFSAEVGAERVIAQEDRARGEEPQGSGGYVSA